MKPFRLQVDEAKNKDLAFRNVLGRPTEDLSNYGFYRVPGLPYSLVPWVHSVCQV